MRKLLIVAAGAGLVALAYEALTHRSLWFAQFKPIPASVPEQMMREARAKGWL